jgi:hypothetical protein
MAISDQTKPQSFSFISDRHRIIPADMHILECSGISRPEDLFVRYFGKNDCVV